ncbi:MAG TPA: heme-binding domain-containing protein [Acidimicrobiales bacterium]
MRRFVKPVLLMVLGVGVLIQLVPYGWDHSNPPVTQDTPWPSEEAREVAVTACYDCHSNETEWPVYSYIAPMSWLVRRDVEAGRDELNFSTWDQDDNDAHDAAETVEEGSMPPSQYVLLHADARLSDEEEQVLIAALEALDEGGGGGDGDDRSGSDSGPG